MKYETFTIGEVAITWSPSNPNHGKEVTIAGPLSEAEIVDAWTGEIGTLVGHLCELPCDWVHGPHARVRHYIRIQSLRKRRPPGVDLQLVHWSECPWQPERLHV